MKGLKLSPLAFTLACLLFAPCAARGQDAEAVPKAEKDERLARILARVGEGVERYQRGMFSIKFVETVRREDLKEDLTPKRSKEYVYESVTLREDFSAAEDDYLARTVSSLKTVDGKPAKKGDAGDAGADLGHEDFLNFLLPKSQKLYQFSFEGEEMLRGRRTFRVGALRPGEGEPRVEWKGGSFVAFAPTRMSVWVDAETGDVLQVESHLAREFEFESPHAFSAGPLGRFGPSRKLKFEREDYAVRFRPVRFKDPEQTLLLPEYAEWLTLITGASRPRTRTTISFTNYRRFRSDVKVIEDQGPDE
jgi:hypothetical protein